MTRKEAKEEITSRSLEYFQPDRSGRGYICPVCGSGSGRKGTGIQTKDGRHFTCFAGGCFTSADIFDIIGVQYGLSSFPEKLDKAAECFGIDLERDSAPLERARTPQNRRSCTSTGNYTPDSKTPQRASQTSYTAYFENAAAHIGETDYHRGISVETLRRFGVGYDPAWVSPKGAKESPSPRLIIPTSPYSYLARHTGSDDDRYRVRKAGPAHIFHESALYEADEPIFVVEGEIDALSIEDAGGTAIGIGGTSGTRLLENAVHTKRPVQPLILLLDDDEAGRKAQKKLASSLEGKCMVLDIYAELGEGDLFPLAAKDANEYLQRDREGFRKWIDGAKQWAAAKAAIAEEERVCEYQAAYSDLGRRGAFTDGISDSVATPCLPTGFYTLDRLLDGGLYEGLYVIGAISSLGKTTLVMQIADQIAASGQDVLIFSLEMGANQLIAKSISRLTYIDYLVNGGEERYVKTARGITSGERYVRYCPAEKELIRRATDDFFERIAPHRYVFEGVGDISARDVRERIKAHCVATGHRPVVIVDYLQILTPLSERFMSDKQNTDKTVLELKRISRDYKIPLIAVSSFNRMSYDKPVSMEAFKESGAIEYSSDVLIALQLKGVGSKDFDVNEAKRRDPRRVEAVILKNRDGRTGDKVAFSYKPRFNYFAEEGRGL